MVARLSLKRLFLALLAVFLTAEFSMSAAQANVISATMKMTADDDKAMPANAGMGKMVYFGMKGDRKACLKGTGDNSNPTHCPPTCIAPALAVVPEGLIMMTDPCLQQPSALPVPFLRGRSSLPDPFPPRPSA